MSEAVAFAAAPPIPVLAEMEAAGWRLWHLHHHTKGHWEARMYRIVRGGQDEDSDFLSPHGSGPTPDAAVRDSMRSLVLAALEQAAGDEKLLRLLELDRAVARLRRALSV